MSSGSGPSQSAAAPTAETAPLRVVRVLRRGPARQDWGEPWNSFIACYAWFLGLQLLDLASTLTVLGLGGGEANPAPASLAAAWGSGAYLASKIGVIVLTFVVWVPAVAWLAKRPAKVVAWAMPALHAGVLMAVVAYTVIVFLNLVNVDVLARR